MQMEKTAPKNYSSGRQVESLGRTRNQVLVITTYIDVKVLRTFLSLCKIVIIAIGDLRASFDYGEKNVIAVGCYIRRSEIRVGN